MATFANLKTEQDAVVLALATVRLNIRKVESDYANMTFRVRRDVHLQGPKARFLLAGAVQHRPSQFDFKENQISSYATTADGPGEMCPVIDLFHDIRAAHQAFDEWVARPGDHGLAHIHELVAKAERVAWNIQILFEVVKRGGDETPPVEEGTETVDEFCMRVYEHYTMVSAMPSGYDGLFAQVPVNDVPLSQQQIIVNWNALCDLVISKNVVLEKAIAVVRFISRNMDFQELAWKNQVREWFEYTPKLGN